MVTLLSIHVNTYIKIINISHLKDLEKNVLHAIFLT
jgi:hypothetical protein